MKLFYVGVKAIIEADNSILFLKKAHKNSQGSYFWDIPGGRIDATETFEETLKRELSEEIGYTKPIDAQTLIHVYRLPEDIDHEYGLVLLYFKINVTIAEIRLSEEHESYTWVHKEDLDTFMQEEAININEGLKKAIKIHSSSLD